MCTADNSDVVDFGLNKEDKECPEYVTEQESRLPNESGGSVQGNIGYAEMLYLLISVHAGRVSDFLVHNSGNS